MKPSRSSGQRRAFITGLSGQDGSYLSEMLLDEGYAVGGFAFGLVPASTLSDRIELFDGDLRDAASLETAIGEFAPDEIYNLAAMSFVDQAFEDPAGACEVNALGVVRILEAIRKLNPKIRFFQASSAEQFGPDAPDPQDEMTPFAPHSPYGISKTFAHQMVASYRDARGFFACCGILFNHESPRRGETFVTRKITRAVAHIQAGLQDKLYLGNLDAKRDWGYAKEYVEAMWLILQQDKADDYVIATNETHSVREFLEAAFACAGLDWKKHVEIDPRYFRPAEVDLLIGDYTKAKRQLGWAPKTRFMDLVKLMVDSDVDLLRRHRQGQIKVSG